MHGGDSRDRVQLARRQRGQLRPQHVAQAQLGDQRHGARSSRDAQHRLEFIAHAFGRHARERGRQILNRVFGLRLQREVKSRGEPRRSQQPQRVFRKSLARRADGPQPPVRQIVEPAHPIDDRSLAVQHVQRVAQQAVDRKVAAEHVLAGVREPHFVWTAAVGIAGFSAESGDLDLVQRIRRVALVDAQNAKRDADFHDVAKQRADFRRVRARRDVKVLGRQLKQQVAHAAADEKCRVPRVAQAPDNRDRCLTGRRGRKMDTGGSFHAHSITQRVSKR